MLSWGRRRQLTILLVLGLFVFSLLVGLYYAFLRPTAGCFDGILNQDERAVDCGGTCVRVCEVEVSSLITFWTRVFRVAPGVYDVGALLENSNAGFAIGRLPYTIRVYDAANVPIAERSGMTFVNQKERFLIFEPRIPTGNRVPTRAVLELGDFEWTRLKSAVVNRDMGIENKVIVLDPTPRVTAELVNLSPKDLPEVTVTTAVFDTEGNVLGVSGTVVDDVPHDGRVPVSFTWPEAFSGTPVTLEIFPRLNAVTP